MNLSLSKCWKVLKTQYIPFFFLDTFTNPYFSFFWSIYPSFCSLYPSFCSRVSISHLIKARTGGKLWRQYHCHHLQNFKLKIPIQNSWIFHTSLLTRGQIALAGRLSLWALGAQTQAVKIKGIIWHLLHIRKCLEQYSGRDFQTCHAVMHICAVKWLKCTLTLRNEPGEYETASPRPSTAA